MLLILKVLYYKYYSESLLREATIIKWKTMNVEDVQKRLLQTKCQKIHKLILDISKIKLIDS